MRKNNIIGHVDQISKLKSAIEDKNISHSYLFQGEDGLGKAEVAKWFSKTLLCEEKGIEACNICSSCIKFETDNHPDFNIIRPEKGIVRKSQIDELVESVSTNPFESDRKIFIIDEAESMNKESMNGLLKTLEEPPSFLNIILITSKENELLPTITSRCEDLKFYPLGREEIKLYLNNNYQLNEKEREFIADFSNGSIGFAKQLVDSDNLFQIRDELIKIVDSLIEGNKSAALSREEFFESNKDNIDLILDFLIYWFRDLAIYKETKNINLTINKDKEVELSKQSLIDFNKINDIIENVEKTRRNIKSNVNFILSIEMMLLSI